MFLLISSVSFCLSFSLPVLACLFVACLLPTNITTLLNRGLHHADGTSDSEVAMGGFFGTKNLCPYCPFCSHANSKSVRQGECLSLTNRNKPICVRNCFYSSDGLPVFLFTCFYSIAPTCIPLSISCVLVRSLVSYDFSWPLLSMILLFLKIEYDITLVSRDR